MENKFIEFLTKQIGEKSLGQIEVISGVSKSYISKVLRGERSTPKPETLKKLSKALSCSYEELMKEAGYLNVDNNVSSVSIGTSFVRVPVFGEIPAGIPIEMIDTSYIEDYEDISTELLKGDKKAFCLKVRGESMMPKFEDGDILVLLQQEDCKSGDYCAVSINHTECTFKKVIKHPNGVTLQPLNPAFEPMFFTNQQIEELPITILGVVVEVRRSL